MAHTGQPLRHSSIVDYLRQNSLVIVTAESCTAGLIASRVAEVPGAGQVLESAFVVYDPSAKRRCLGVPASLLEQHNLTSEPVALAMAFGALERSNAALAIANTGIADDSDPDVAPGTQCYAWVFRAAGSTCAFSETQIFRGERNQIRGASADYALGRIVHYHQHYLAMRKT